MAIQSSQSTPGQLAAAIAAAHPRAKAVAMHATGPLSGLMPPEETAETLAKLMGERPENGSTETAAGAD